jgi:hypothetical protein
MSDDRVPNPRNYEAEALRHRIIWIAGALIVLAAVVAYFVLRDDGEQNRQAYCDALSDVMGGGTSLQAAADSASRAEIERVADLAPSAVAPAWDGLSTAVLDKDPSPTQQETNAAKMHAELDRITEDAGDKCDLTITP